MIEENIIEWLQLGDLIQKIEIYNSKYFQLLFKANYLLSQYGNFSEYIYLIFIFLFFAQIWELNLLKINVEGDGLLEILKYLEKIFLFRELIINIQIYILFIILILIIYFSSIILIIVNLILLHYKKKIRALISINSFLIILLIYYVSGPSIEIAFSSILYNNGKEIVLITFENGLKLFSLIFNFIYSGFMIICIFCWSLYFNNVGCINKSNVKCKVTNNFTLIISIIKIIIFIFHFILKFLIKNNLLFILSYHIFIALSNFFISLYTYKKVFFYNNIINNWFHFGFYYTTWFSICILLKIFLQIKDITLFVIVGIIIITFGFYFNDKNKIIQLLTEANILETNNLKDIEMYINSLLILVKKNDHKSKILISGIISRFEEYARTNSEILENYTRLLNDKHLKEKFNSYNELAILSIISIIYSHNIEKNKNVTDLTINMCYFLVNKFKNPTYAISLCTKIKKCTHIQSYYKYSLMEEIKDYLISILTKNRNKISIKHVQISSVILYNQYMDLFKMKIYDATCSQIEYFDILKSEITTSKTSENFLKTGDEVLSLRKDILNLWEKIILLNPFNDENEKDFILYLDTIKDDVLKRTEEKRFNTLKASKLSEKSNVYYSMFNHELSAVLLSDGNSYNGKIFYATPNFPSLFMFNEKEVLNTSIDDLLPDVVKSFHKFLIEDAIKYSNLTYIFKRKRDILIKGKNGLLFNIYIYIKPAPKLSFGLIYFIYLEKIQEQNFILTLDENLLINGFTGMNQTDSNFTMNNCYGLSYNIFGHHIGLIIPEILLQLDYDNKNNTFFLSKNNIDLKGYLYSNTHLKELDNNIAKILDVIKKRKNDEFNNEIKSLSFQEYDELIKELNLKISNPFSIFFRIELHNFIGGKYKYYRINVINDLLSGNENSFNIQSNHNPINNDENNNLKKEINNDTKSIKFNELNQNNDNNNSDQRNKIIKIRTEFNKKETNARNINFIDEDNKDNLDDITKNININFSKPSNPSSVLSQSNSESSEFNKLKKDIIDKKDSLYFKLMKYLSYIIIIINIIFITYDYFYSTKKINSMIKFLKENLYFTQSKISTACIYNTASFLEMIKKGFILDDSCFPIKCHQIYGNLLENCLKEVREQKINISYFYSDFQKIFNQKIHIDLYIYNRTYKDHLKLDMDNFLNLMIAQGMKLISNLSYYINNENKGILEIYQKNLLINSLKYFYSDYTGFTGKEKEIKCYNISSNYPLRFAIIIIINLLILGLFGYFIYFIYVMQIFCIDRLINFNSTNFDDYLKNLEEFKKKFRDDNTDENEKSEKSEKIDDIDGKNVNKTQIQNKKDINNNKKNKKQNKLQQQKLKKKKIMNSYFYKTSLLFFIKMSLFLIISIIYFFSSIINTTKMKKNYKQFDSILEQVNNVYFDSYKIFLNFKEQIEIFSNTHNKTNLKIPKDSEINRPKFGNCLLNIIKNTKYSEDSIKIIDTLYNTDACQILSENEGTYMICQTIFSSILTKGLDQAIVQMGIILTSIIDELNSLKNNKNLYDIYTGNSSYNNYEIFMGEIMLQSFFKTQSIFEIFINDEKSYIDHMNKIILNGFNILYLILFFYLIFFLLSYKKIIVSFFNFVGIIPAKYLAEEETLYKALLKMDHDYY